jgi:hypothetical protein
MASSLTTSENKPKKLDKNGRPASPGRPKGLTKEVLVAQRLEKIKKKKQRATGSLLEQLYEHGFDFVKELAKSLKDLPPGKKYDELRSLLPFVAPKIKDKEKDDTPPAPDSDDGVSDADLLNAILGKQQPTQPAAKPPEETPKAIEGPGTSDVMEAGDTRVQVSGGAEEDLLRMDRGEDSD